MQSGNTSTDADMWDLTLYDVFGIGEDYRGKSPVGHIGKSENYFVSMTPTRAFCFKRKATYTPATGVLVKEGERYAKDPEGELSDWETFVYWRYLREKGIVNDNPPNKALVAYAKRHNIASSGDGISMREGNYGEFESLDKDRLYQVLDDIERRFSIDIEWDPFGDRGNKSDTSSDEESGTERRTSGSESAESDGQSRSDQSTSSGDSTGSSDQRASTAESGGATSSGAATESSQSSSESSSSSSQNEADHNDTQSTEDSDSPNNTEVESTLATGDTADSTDDSSEPDSPANEDGSANDNKSTSQDSETTHTGDESPVVKSASDDDQSKQTDSDEDVDPIKQRHDSNRQSEDELDVAVEVEGGVNLNDVEEEINSDDLHDRFNTYEEPDADEGEYDPDREAVKQFVAGFCRVDGDRKDELKAPKDDVFNALVKWIKINGVEVDDLSDDVYITNRKGNLKNILTDEYDVESKQVSIDGERVYAFRGMVLSDGGEELLNANID